MDRFSRHGNGFETAMRLNPALMSYDTERDMRACLTRQVLPGGFPKIEWPLHGDRDGEPWILLRTRTKHRCARWRRNWACRRPTPAIQIISTRWSIANG